MVVRTKMRIESSSGLDPRCSAGDGGDRAMRGDNCSDNVMVQFRTLYGALGEIRAESARPAGGATTWNALCRR